jgi:hypothetical protein
MDWCFSCTANPIGLAHAAARPIATPTSRLTHRPRRASGFVQQIAGANSRPALGFSAAPISSRRFIPLWLSSYPLGTFTRMELLFKEAESLSLPCFDLVPAEGGEPVHAHWRGRRSDLPEEFPDFVTAFRNQEHILSVEQELFEKLGLRGRQPLALSMVTTAEGDEKLDYASVSTGNLREVVFEDSVALTAKPARSLPPFEALILYGGAAVQEWLSALKLERWQYSDVPREFRDEYCERFNAQLPLCLEQPPFARIGGWHVPWAEDSFYIPREMRLMIWTFEDAEPWHEVFLSPMRNYVLKSRIT